jgi:CBS domain containing-hemolysin-like protein
MVTPLVFYMLAVVLPMGALVLFAYLDRVYRELGRVTTGRLHTNLDTFEAELEPRLGMNRRTAGLTFSILSYVWFALVAVQTARGVSFFVTNTAEAVVQQVIYVATEIALGMILLPYLLLTRTSGRWLVPLVPVVRICAWIIWPLRAGLEVVMSLTELARTAPTDEQSQQEGLEALVEVAEEEGILKREEADLIEQVVEFSDKRVRDVMTPRPEVVSIPADATVEQLRRVLVETKYSRIPVYENALDEIIGIAYARDVLQIPERDAARRTVRELARPALFVPETKLGSQLLKEMQQKHQQMAIAIDEYGSVAGIVTIEDLVEEIVGEIGEEDRAPTPEVVRESDGSLVMRGSVPVEKVRELLEVEFGETESTTIAGLLNALAGHVPRPGEVIESDALRFEVLEANQRKVLRLRVRRKPHAVPATQT